MRKILGGCVPWGFFDSYEILGNETLPLRSNCRDARVSWVHKHFEAILDQFQAPPTAFE